MSSSYTVERQSQCCDHRYASTVHVSHVSHCSSRRRRPVAAAAALPGIAVLADVIIQTPTNTAAAQNTVQNLLTSVPEPVKEAPERLIIAASLIAVAVGGYLLRERTRSK